MRKGYGGDPTVYQLRDMQRRITALEKSKDRADARIRNLQSRVVDQAESIQVLRAIALRTEERIS